jgi:DNA-binding response OmpR family regulator
MAVSLVDTQTHTLTASEQAVLRVLVDHAGRVVTRRDLARLAGLSDHHTRRCDSILVGIRRQLGAGAVRTVRSRGWLLETAVARHAQALLGVG